MRGGNRLLHKCGLVILAKSMERDSERQTVSKLMLETAQNKSELDAQREILAQLSHQVSSLGHQLNQVRHALHTHTSSETRRWCVCKMLDARAGRN